MFNKNLPIKNKNINKIKMKKKDNDNPIVYLGFFLLGIFLLAALL